MNTGTAYTVKHIQKGLTPPSLRPLFVFDYSEDVVLIKEL